ncbi:hypothetical protein WJX74_003942 [Apatococcus lobatus]|uniref:Uncharacterized protein n=1 Tax=Apatococcus lobatus TaxID=904363 RepID=A0AAW1QHU8_9CHLO
MALACTTATIGLLRPQSSEADGTGSAPAMRRLRANTVISNLTNTIGSKFSSGSDTLIGSGGGWGGWGRKAATLNSPGETLLETEAPAALTPVDPYPLESNLECPRSYQRIRYEDIKAEVKKPYLLGGEQEPNCTTCKLDNNWVRFSRYESNGPICPWEDRQRLQRWLVERAELGAPDGKELLELTPCDLFAYLRGRTLWLVGDSMTQAAMRAMMAFFIEFWDLGERWLETLTDDRWALDPLHGGWCIELPEGTRICHLRANMGDWLADILMPRMVALGARTNDIAVVNFAVWINEWHEYRDNLARFAGAYMTRGAELPFIIWRDASVQHFNSPDGHYKPGMAQDCQPIPGMSLDHRNYLHALDVEQAEVEQGGWRNMLSNPLMERLGIPIQHSWNKSVPLDSYHHHFHEWIDCTHSCHPSVYQIWIYDLYKVLEDNKSRLIALDRAAAQQTGSHAPPRPEI